MSSSKAGGVENDNKRKKAVATVSEKSPAAKRTRKVPTTDAADSGNELATTVAKDETLTATTTLKKKTGHAGSEPHVRDIIIPKPLSEEHKFIKVISWNVCGMKSLAAKNLAVLTNLVATHKPDVLCLQETKLQVNQVDEFRDIIPGYDSYWSCSIDKKGYSGTAVFLNNATIDTKNALAAATAAGTADHAAISATSTSAPKKGKQSKLTAFIKKVDSEPVVAVAVTEPTATSATPAVEPLVKLQRVSFDFEDEKRMFHGEGRTITVELDNMIIVAVYVPNSGEGLVRLDYRTKQWDVYVREYINKLSLRKPVIYTGDLNVGHLDLDIHNPTAKHIVKQAGLTPQERESHTALLGDTFKDALRYFYPDARGLFTYWSMRTFARPVNKGIRLDYFLCSNNMFPATQQPQASSSNSGSDGSAITVERVNDVSAEDTPTPGVYDSYTIPDDTKGCSDHAPVVLVVKV